MAALAMSLKESFSSFDQWKVQQIKALENYLAWLERDGACTQEDRVEILESISSLESDQLTIAFVGEFSRGKTELINSLFFADFGRRLLPSMAGRTTMCPTEIFYDAKAENSAYIKLLDIDSRLQNESISELKKKPECWHTIHLDLDSPDQITEAFNEVIRSVQVSPEKAKALGLLEQGQGASTQAAGDSVEVPKWRHALISFPHPMLRRGLTIIDTPGLNALGSEPELTLNLLPSAHGVFFMLAADTGVTQSDLEIWNHYIRGGRGADLRCLVVALNKIDTLWDELQDEAYIEGMIETQRLETAKQLGIPIDNVFPLSAQKSLLAKIRGDRDLLSRSRVGTIENYISKDILDSKQQLLANIVGDRVSHRIGSSVSLKQSLCDTLGVQLAELKGLRGQNETVIEQMVTKSRNEQARYHQDLVSFHASKQVLGKQLQIMLEAINMREVDRNIIETHREMATCWTTVGLHQGIQKLFSSMTDTMDELTSCSAQTKGFLDAVYKKFQEDGDVSLIPKPFPIEKHNLKLEQVFSEAEAFRRSPIMMVTEQTYVVKRFFATTVSLAREVFITARKEAEVWAKGVLVPLTKKIKMHKELIDQRLETLGKINKSKSSLSAKIRDLEIQQLEVKEKIMQLEDIQAVLNYRVELMAIAEKQVAS